MRQDDADHVTEHHGRHLERGHEGRLHPGERHAAVAEPEEVGTRAERVGQLLDGRLPGQDEERVVVREQVPECEWLDLWNRRYWLYGIGCACIRHDLRMTIK